MFYIIIQLFCLEISKIKKKKKEEETTNVFMEIFGENAFEEYEYNRIALITFFSHHTVF